MSALTLTAVMFIPFATLLFLLGAQALDLHRVSTTTFNTTHSAPTVHCWCSSYPNRTQCSWVDPPEAVPLHYIATYSERHRQAVTKPCNLIPPGNPSSELTTTLPSSTEQRWFCHLPDLKLLTDYILNVTAVYPEDSSSHISTFMIEDIVKPDPPVDARVSTQDSSRVLVEWDPPSTWTDMDVFPLKYQIKYQWWIMGEKKFVNLGPFESTRAFLSGLSRRRLYQFQVCAKDILGLGYCSDWSAPVNMTIP